MVSENTYIGGNGDVLAQGPSQNGHNNDLVSSNSCVLIHDIETHSWLLALCDQGPLLPSWFNFNQSIDKKLHAW